MLSHSTKRSGGKKRGRPAASSMQKGKSSIEQVRRVLPRRTKGPAKINEVESDSSDHTNEKTNAETGNIGTLCCESLGKNEFRMLENEKCVENKRGSPERNTQKGKAKVEQVRRTRARIAKGDGSDYTDVKTNAEEAEMERGNVGTVCKDNSKTEELKMLEDCDWKQKGKAIEQIDVADPKSKNSENSEKLEVMTDPLQAMLLDMVPSLGMSETKSSSSSSSVLEEKQPAKKKVSYKDVASELLKDW